MKPRAYFSITLVLAALWQGGCVFNMGPLDQDSAAPRHDKADFADPVLMHRQILLFGDIDEKAAERTIQQMLFLDGQSHDPIDLYLMTPGGEFQSALAIEHVMRVIKSPVNSYALSECNSGGALLLA